MAKKCLIEKHKRQTEMFDRLAAEERAIMQLPKEKQAEAYEALKARRVKNRQFKTRKYKRCMLTGRAHGYIGYFGICRQSFRELAHKGMLPGVTKSSW